ncbi:hypothetical protein Lser_V15G32665 [Lactuca serriola]
MSIAKHYETGETLPEEIYQKLLAARTFRAGTLSLRQLKFATVDLELHSKYVPGGSKSIYDVERRVSEKTQVLPLLEEDMFLYGFSHIFAGGYAVGYYSYKWAEVLSTDAFSTFKDAGLNDDKDKGQIFVAVNFEGYSTHFGTCEAARWFLTHEMGTINDCLHKHQGFRLRLVGHSFGGAISSMLSIMIRKKTCDELGFSPDIVTTIGYGTPPCVSRYLADSCSNFVTTVCMQVDFVATLMRLRKEILQTDW